MPVTAKFSEKFYQTLGHGLVDELVDWCNQVDATYRSEFRELFDTRFALFDAKLEQRIAEVKADLKAEMHAGLASIRAEIATLRGDMIKWMFTFWAGSAVTTVATVWGVVSFLR